MEDLLKKGAYGALMEDDRAGENFCEEDIEHILQQRTHVRHIEPGVKGSTFAKASFNMSTNRSDINIDDPQFWQKWAKKAEIDVNGGKVYCSFMLRCLCYCCWLLCHTNILVVIFHIHLCQGCSLCLEHLGLKTFLGTFGSQEFEKMKRLGSSQC